MCLCVVCLYIMYKVTQVLLLRLFFSALSHAGKRSPTQARARIALARYEIHSSCPSVQLVYIRA